MNGGPATAPALALAIRGGFGGSPGAGRETFPEVALFPPFVSIPVVVECVAGSGIAVGGQDLHWESAGAFTGEISGAMLAECGATHVLVGHSERRHLFGESDRDVARKTAAALRAGLVPVVCLGETLAERESGETRAVLERQFAGGPATVPAREWGGLVIAYEPVWAIGTGRNATPETAREAHGAIRELVSRHAGPDIAAAARILYGGSVNGANAAAYFGEDEVDGVLVGGASLKAGDFLKIIEEAVAWSRS